MPPKTNALVTHRIKRQRVNRDDVKRFLALDGDCMLGTDKNLERTTTYVIERIDNQMAACVRRAIASTRDDIDVPVFHVCDAHNSLMIFNSMYGMSIDVPILDEPDTPPDNFHLFSAFHSHMRRTRLKPELFVYEVPFGGVVDCGPDPRNMHETLFMPRPAVMCMATQDLLYTTNSAEYGFGWRALLYENTGTDDPWPTGLVALEGWLFETRNGQGVDVEDHATLAKYMQEVIDRAPALVAEYKAKYAEPPATADAPPSQSSSDEHSMDIE